MSQRLGKNRGRKSGQRRTTLLWVAAAALAIFVLLYFEQTAILYVLATLGVTALLLVVAFSDLKGARSAEELPRPADDAAAIGTGIGSTIPPRTTSRSGRSAKR